MKKRIKQVLSVLTAMILLLLCGVNNEYVTIEDSPVALDSGYSIQSKYVQETQDDLILIPDKYNTGAMGELNRVELGDNVNEIQLAVSGGAVNVLDFYYHNKTKSGTIIFRNYDFSGYEFAVYNEEKVTDRTIKIIFENCKFAKISVGKAKGNFSYEFNNCSINTFLGSNAVFNECRFGGNYTDGLNPFQNVHVNNSLICNLTGAASSTKAVHSDGTQIYGNANLVASDIEFINCRFEVPPIPVENSMATVNACIMVQLEYGNADGISFEHCIVNGGGYSIYAWDKNKGLQLSNIKLKDIRVGAAKVYGTFYSHISPGVNLTNIVETDSLYVASVWRENGKTHFSVTNDTNQERIFYIYTDVGEYEYIIPACPKGKNLSYSDSYEKMPFDIDVAIDNECKYAVCFDNTFEGAATQIRYVNWSGESVTLPQEVLRKVAGGENDIIYQGFCGKNVEYKLTKAGVLTLVGTGTTDSYHSKKPTPWNEYSDLIKKVVVEEGITRLGGQIFVNCSAVQEVEFPNSLECIAGKAFAGCTSLRKVVLPANILEIGNAAFPFLTMREISYQGDDLSNVEMLPEDAQSINKLLVEESITETVSKPVAIAEGKCGVNAWYTLDKEGTMTICGSGTTYNYHSKKPTPWNEYRSMIKKVVVEKGITKIGEQLFNRCDGIEQIELNEGLMIIGRNAFIACKAVKNVNIPSSVVEIQQRAFAATAPEVITYAGSAEQWNDIKIEPYNEILSKVLTGVRK